MKLNTVMDLLIHIHFASMHVETEQTTLLEP